MSMEDERGVGGKNWIAGAVKKNIMLSFSSWDLIFYALEQAPNDIQHDM